MTQEQLKEYLLKVYLYPLPAGGYAHIKEDNTVMFFGEHEPNSIKCRNIEECLKIINRRIEIDKFYLTLINTPQIRFWQGLSNYTNAKLILKDGEDTFYKENI
jgi:hypothetical protein